MASPPDDARDDARNDTRAGHEATAGDRGPERPAADIDALMDTLPALLADMGRRSEWEAVWRTILHAVRAGHPPTRDFEALGWYLLEGPDDILPFHLLPHAREWVEALMIADAGITEHRLGLVARTFDNGPPNVLRLAIRHASTKAPNALLDWAEPGRGALLRQEVAACSAAAARSEVRERLLARWDPVVAMHCWPHLDDPAWRDAVADALVTHPATIGVALRLTGASRPVPSAIVTTLCQSTHPEDRALGLQLAAQMVPDARPTSDTDALGDSAH